MGNTIWMKSTYACAQVILLLTVFINVLLSNWETISNQSQGVSSGLKYIHNLYSEVIMSILHRQVNK